MRSRYFFWAALVLCSAASAGSAWAQNGLVGEYYTNNQFNGNPVVVPNDDITPFYAAGNNNQIPAIAPTTDNFSVRWRGMIDIPADGSWTFFVTPDDYGRVWIGGQLVVAQHSANAELSGVITLTAGLHPILLEWVEFTGNQRFLFQWQGPSVAKANVPLAQLSSPASPVLPAAPTIDSGNGGLVPVNNVTLSTTTAGTAIYYTLDGSDPGISVPSGGAILYTGPFTVNQHAQLRARAYATPLNGLASQLTVSNGFSPSFAPVVPPGPTQAGLYYRYFHTTNATLFLSDFDASQPPAPPQMRGGVATVSHTITPARDRNDTFALIETGYLTVATAGMWTFFTSSDEGSQLYIHGKLVVQNDGMRGANVERSGQIFLEAGTHPIEVRYFERTGGEALTASWQGPAGNNPAKQTIPASALSTEQIVATPVFSPAPPLTFAGSQVVTINCATPGALIYYTTDGSAPDPRRASGFGPDGVQVTLTETSTLRAMAILSPMNPSAVTSYAVSANAVYTKAETGTASAIASGIDTEVVVTFDRPVTAASAGTLGNYAVDNGITVSGATVIPKTNALVAHWRLDALPPVDATGVNAPGTATNATLDATNFAPGPTGNAASFSFNGTDAIVSFADADSLEVGAGSFTVTAWIRPSNVVGVKRIVGKWDPAADSNNGIGWFLNLSGDDLRFRVRSIGQNHEQTPNLTIPADQWTFVAGRYDRLTRRLAIFVNGVQVVTNDGSTTLDDVSNAVPLGIGAQPGAPASDFFAGQIDDVRVWRVSLSNEEIRALNAGVDSMSSAVRLTTSVLTPGTLYTLSIQNVTDHFGVPVSSPSTRTFRYQPTGSVWMDRFNGLTGTSIANLTRSAIFPNQPSDGGSLSTFRVPQSDPDASNFGIRIRGYFIPGTTGDWRLGIASDDMGQLWLSSNEDPSNMVLVSRVVSFATLDQYSHANARQSGLIPLVAGRKYYIEALQKEGGGGDHIAVAAKLDDGTPIANGTAALTGAVISPFAPAPAFLQHPVGIVSFPGASHTLSVLVDAAAPIAYQWRLDGADLIGATGRTLVLSNLQVGDSGDYTVEVTTGAGTAISRTAVVSIVAPAPTVASIEAIQGTIAGGETVTLTGTNFFNGYTSVLFDGVPATGVVALSGTYGVLTAVVPAHAEGTVDVTVVNPGAAGSATLSNGYSYWAPPTLTSVDGGPAMGAFGPLAGGNTVTLTGTSFVAGYTTVSFDGLPATAVNVTSATTLTCVVPAHAAGAVDVVLTAPGGAVTLASGYEYVPVPTAASVTPTSGPLVGGQAFSVTGTALIPGYTRVVFAANDATGVVVAGTRDSLTGSTPAGAGVGTVAVTVVTPGGSSAAIPGGFTYYAPPTISGLTVVDGPTAGGQTLTINGTNFLAGQTTVTFGGVAAAINGLTATTIDVTTPAHAAGAVNVEVSTPGGTATLSNGYTYHPPPTASGLDITTGPTIGGTTVTITGTEFRSGLTTATFGGVAGTSVVVGGGNTTLTVQTPSHAPGTFDVVVITPGGQVTVPQQFTFSGPFISSITPNAGLTGGGQTATIDGFGFTGTTSVTFDGLAAAFTVLSANQISITSVPGHAAGAVTVVVTTPGGIDDLPAGFTYYDAPTLASIALDEGPAIGGQTVTLTGTSFAPGFTTVTFDGTPATGVAVGGGGTTLTCITPAHAAGAVTVQVTTFGTASASLVGGYTYHAPPTVSLVAPRRGPTTGGQTVTISGANFVPGRTTVLFGAAPAGAVTVAPGGTSLTCVTPAGTGVVSVQVTTFGTQTATIPNIYTYVDASTTVDLALSLLSSNPSPGFGEGVVLTLTLGNTGGVGGTGISVRTVLPPGISFLTASATAGTYDAATGIWTVGSLGVSANATLTIQVRVDTTNLVTATSEVFTCAQEDVDSTPNNGIVGEDDLVSMTFQTALQITSAGLLPAATAEAFYWQPIGVIGGAAPYTFTLASGALPFNLDPATGVISGFAPAGGPAVYNFAVTVTDSGGPPNALTQGFIITLNPVNGAAPTVNTIPALPDGEVGAAYDRTFTAIDGQPPYTWSVSVPALPGGLTLNAQTGRLAGTPTASGTFNFTIQATCGTGSGSQAFSITVAPPAFDFRTIALPGASTGQFYNQLVELEGGLGPTFTWSVISGALPPGLTLGGTTRTATISGTPTMSGPHPFTLQAVDNGPSGATLTRVFGITVASSGGLAFEITTAALPLATQGRAYSASLNSRGGSPPPAWSLAAGDLPAGILLSAALGQFSGTPLVAGRFELMVLGTTAAGSDTQVLTLDVAPAPRIDTPLILPDAFRNQVYAQALSVVGGQAPFRWTAAGLPSGLSIDLYSGMITGIPTGAGGSFDVTVTEFNGGTDTVTFSLTVLNPGAGLVLAASPPTAHVGVPYSTSLTAQGGTPPYAYSVLAGTLPAWASLDPATGVISGTPTATGTFTLTFQVADGVPATADAGPVDLVVADLLNITPNSAPGADPNVPYSLALTASGASGAVTWQISGGKLPVGFTLDSLTGVISGTSAVPGFSFTRVRVTDSLGRTAERSYTILVAPGASASPGAETGSEGGTTCSLASTRGGGNPWTALLAAGMIAFVLLLAGRRAA
jgi:uncharacterized repeat protein (TIGR01451 family)